MYLFFIKSYIQRFPIKSVKEVQFFEVYYVNIIQYYYYYYILL